MGIFSQIKKRFSGKSEAEASKDLKQPTPRSTRGDKSRQAELIEAKKKTDAPKVEKKETDAAHVVASTQKIIKHPDVTEKSTMLQAQGQYVFVVSDRATKIEVGKAIHSMYKVDVMGVRMLIQKGKPMGSGRNAGRRSDVKKAIVSLKKGQSVSIFDGEK